MNLQESGNFMNKIERKIRKERQSKEAFTQVAKELQWAYENWPDMYSYHDGYVRMRKEAIQVAAMAIRFMVDCCGEK
jgi:hypothetical protein